MIARFAMEMPAPCGAPYVTNMLDGMRTWVSLDPQPIGITRDI
jgi:hypothetical protein